MPTEYVRMAKSFISSVYATLNEIKELTKSEKIRKKVDVALYELGNAAEYLEKCEKSLRKLS